MRNNPFSTLAITGAALTVLIGATLLPQQDRYRLKVPDGLAFSEFKGYDAWQTIAVSETEGSVKAILGNPTMITVYKYQQSVRLIWNTSARRGIRGT